MGNIGSSKRQKTTKIMKIDGETFKLKTPIKAGDVLKDHNPNNNSNNLVLLDSEAVKHYGIRAKPLEAHKELEAKRLYFLVEIPKEKALRVPPRRVRSGINMSAKDRLESLMLSRRSTSDLTIMKHNVNSNNDDGDGDGGVMRLKMKLPKAEVERLMNEAKDESEAAQRIMSLCMANRNHNIIGRREDGGESSSTKPREVNGSPKTNWSQIRRRYVSVIKLLSYTPVMGWVTVYRHKSGGPYPTSPK
ncbi:plastid movement impaired protein [Senna tora]|uniref:Plastid movement impaired protein n=1 Tax=Senna tora TaxID=362788 RepID=A0A834WLG8_9FABA|nr:plastid movement impaired protein [Senna tora]